MAYVAVKGGKEAIEASIRRLQYERLKSGTVLDTKSVRAGLRSLIDQVMSEASLYSEEVAAIAIKQAEGSPEEAVFLLRAFRSTLPRKYYSRIIDGNKMRVERRISAAFKDIPGGQILGASTDYTHRLIDINLADESTEQVLERVRGFMSEHSGGGHVGFLPKVVDVLRREGLMRKVKRSNASPKDVTKKSVEFPTSRSERIQIMTRGQTGAVTALGYASLRGYGGGALHPTVAELRVGRLDVLVDTRGQRYEEEDDDDGDSYYLGQIKVTEVESIIPVSVPRGQGREDLKFEIGYGVCFGQNETKAIAMSLLDNCLETRDARYATHDEEFVLLHIDSVEATGFISHLKLPHYVTFQSKLDSMRVAQDNGGHANSAGQVSAEQNNGKHARQSEVRK